MGDMTAMADDGQSQQQWLLLVNHGEESTVLVDDGQERLTMMDGS